jgi:hypothetical protein
MVSVGLGYPQTSTNGLLGERVVRKPGPFWVNQPKMVQNTNIFWSLDGEWEGIGGIGTRPPVILLSP